MRWITLVVAAILYGCGSGDPAPEAGGAYLDAAVRVGRWLGSQSNGGGNTPDRVGLPGSSPGLGEGSAGRAIFYAELFAATGDSGFAESARLEALASLARLAMHEDAPANASLYRGTAGIAFSLAEVGRIIDDSAIVGEGRRLFGEVVTAVGDGPVSPINDVIVGLSGVGLGLLYAYGRFRDDALLSAATTIGDTLIARAESVEPDGLRWLRGLDQPVDLPNFSHGTAGVGFFLARLGAASSAERFSAAGAQAARYLDSVTDRSDGLLLVPYGVPNEGYVSPYDIGWAHGPPGTARLHFERWLGDGDPEHLTLVEASARTVVASGIPGTSADTARWRGPFRLDRRFGTSGAAAFLFDAGEALRDREYTRAAFSVTDGLLRRAQSRNEGLFWSLPLYGFQDGTGDAVFTGFFYGAAGLGLTLLRAHHAATGGSMAVRFPDDPFGSGRRPASRAPS